MNNLKKQDLESIIEAIELEMGVDSVDTLVDFYDVVDTKDSFEDFSKNAQTFKFKKESYNNIEYYNIVEYQLNKGDTRLSGLFFKNVNNTNFNIIILS